MTFVGSTWPIMVRGRVQTAASLLLALLFLAVPANSQQAAAAAVKKIGTVKAINGSTLALKTDAGPEVSVQVQDSTRIVRLAPGSTDVKTATPMELKDIQVGDRMLVRAATEADPLTASLIIVMKQAELAQKQQQERQDWQRRGAGGIVNAIDAANGTITVAVTPNVSFVVKTTPSTGFLRYAPDSVKFSDAKRGTFDQIKTGDQLRARGNRSADGKELTAEEIVSGTFRNIAGTISAVDTRNNAVTIKDLIAKKTVVVKITGDTQMRKLTPQMAQGLAFLLKRSDGSDSAQPAPASGSGAGPGAGGAGASAPGGPGTRGSRGGGDLQQMLSRVPPVSLADLQKEDAVMIVSTTGTGGAEVTAITLLGGVEPILTASPNGMNAAALLAGWNLSAPAGDAGPQ